MGRRGDSEYFYPNRYVRQCGLRLSAKQLRGLDIQKVLREAESMHGKIYREAHEAKDGNLQNGIDAKHESPRWCAVAKLFCSGQRVADVCFAAAQYCLPRKGHAHS